MRSAEAARERAEARLMLRLFRQAMKQRAQEEEDAARVR
jgi:hypothetical protein